MRLLLLLILLSGCASREEGDRLFSLLDARRTNVDFENALEDQTDFNILDYLYYYDGGGVAIGDVDNDGLDDLFFTGNRVPNRLYLNRGDFRFEDVTQRAGVAGPESAWSTGVTMADVDGDGWLDIYVCQVHYGPFEGRNRLYINNRDGTFSEQAAAYGLAFQGLSTQAAFFDYDRDGDLDLYLLNHAVHTRDSFVESWRRIIDAPGGDRLYRNDGGHFTNVTSDAGIYSSVLGYGLGLAVSDVNQDGWPDVYVGNDFHENDYLYLNNGDGTFTESLGHVIGHTSQSSMGNDVADIDNDGRVDIVSLDMLPPDVATYRRSGGPDADDLARIKRDFGYAPQYARNTLQWNRGHDEEGRPLFSEIGTYAGIHATDWSWAGLFADLDNDGWKDLYVTNGILRRPNDLDYVDHISRPDVQRLLNEGSAEEQLAVTRRMPAAELPNFAFRNNGDLTFTDHAEDWGLAAPGFSHGAAYADLDNDGDLDLVVNDVNGPARIYRNNLRENAGEERSSLPASLTDSREEGPGEGAAGSAHYLSISLEGEGGNTSGIGAKVFLYGGGHTIYLEQSPTRGFQSAVSHVLHAGLGPIERLDSLVVVWPDGRFQRIENVDADQRLRLRQADASESYDFTRPVGEPLLRAAGIALDFVHRENEFSDLRPLHPRTTTTSGPALAVGDVDGDGLDDIYLGGAHGQPGALFIQRPSGFVRSDAPFAETRDREDVDALFFDADGDGDLDLYVVSGGGEAPAGDDVYRDRLYLNDGSGEFVLTEGRLPELFDDGCCVAAGDYDGDGDLDLFVGSRSVPGSYGAAPESRILENDGGGTFREVDVPALESLGMVTDAVWADLGDDALGGDGSDDIASGRTPHLIIVGEWMPVTVLRREGDALADVTESLGLAGSGGLWNAVEAVDVDGDGDVDVIAGNLGANSILRTPLELYVHDFDGDGASDPLVVETIDGSRHTWARRDELLAHMPSLAERMPSHDAYAEMTLEELVDAETLRQAEHRTVHVLHSAYLENRGAEGFVLHELPAAAQLAPVMDVLAVDVDGDGHVDLLTGENFYGADTKQGRYDAGLGTLLLGNGSGAFESVPMERSGFVVRGQARALGLLRLAGGRRALLGARNNNTPQLFLLPEVTGAPP